MKKLCAFLLAAGMLFSLTACGKGEHTETFTGIVEDKTSEMVVVAAEDGSNSYLFELADGVVCDAQEGDKITVTYTGDISQFDPTGAGDEELVAVRIKAEK